MFNNYLQALNKDYTEPIVLSQVLIKKAARELTKSISNLRVYKLKLGQNKTLSQQEHGAFSNLTKKQEKLAARFSYQLTLLIYFTFIATYRGYTGPLYFPCMYDFRGRYYYWSAVSPQGYAIYRYIFHYGAYSSKDLTAAWASYQDPRCKVLLDNITWALKAEELLGLAPLEGVYRAGLLVCLLELGRLKRKEMPKEVTLASFISRGFEVLVEIVSVGSVFAYCIGAELDDSTSYEVIHT